MKLLFAALLATAVPQDDQKALTLQADALYEEGNTKEALVKYAQALGKEDPEAFIAEQRKKVTQALLRASMKSLARISPWEPKVGPEFKQYGVWAIPALVDGLAGNNRSSDFQVIFSGFRALGKLSIPPLRSILKSDHAGKRLVACEMLGEVRVKDKESIRLLQRISEDRNETDSVRAAAFLAHHKMYEIEPND